MKKIFSLVFVTVLIIMSLSGCSSSFSLTCRIGDYPITLDPQVAKTSVQLTIAQNAFEGLMRFDSDGNAVPGAAESYEVTNNGKTYIFTLRDNLKWSNGTELTAQDFKFGLERATLSSTGAVYGYMLSSIVGAEDRLSGKNTSLGVSVIGKNKLSISLSEANESFLSALCHPVASPCNEEYFNSCNGKYGMTAKTLISNGFFKISYYVENDVIRLLANSNYEGTAGSKCTKIEFDFMELEEGKELKTEILNNSWDISLVDEAISEAAENAQKIVYKDYDSMYFLLLNPASSLCKNPNVRRALIMSLGSSESSVYKSSDTVLPANLNVFGKPVNKISGFVNYSRIEGTDAKTLFVKYAPKALLSDISKIPVHCPDDDDFNEVAKNMVAGWQKELGAYFNISSHDEATMSSVISSGNYSIAFAKIKSSDHTVQNYISNVNNAICNPKALDEVLSGVIGADDSDELIGALNEYSVALENGAYAVPMYKSSTDYVIKKGIDGFTLTTFGTIDFTNITK